MRFSDQLSTAVSGTLRLPTRVFRRPAMFTYEVVMYGVLVQRVEFE
jgi:hypothetical protein